MPTQRPLAIWLFVCAALIYAMVVLGGVTRLTHSGLSIVEWAPVVGAIPPRNEQQWQSEFDKYRQTPEYRQVNTEMTLTQFQSIYWVEYAHRLLGRAIGLAFLIPFLYFLWRRRIDRPLGFRLGGLFLLGGLQGALGWYMVASGLVDIPRVSAYRLTAHLGLAVTLYGGLVWLALELLDSRFRAHADAPRLARASAFVTALIFVMILSGGFVAGTRAGFAYNTFPLMDGGFTPPGMFALEPWWANLFENIATVQFNHRLLAYTVALTVLGFWSAARAYRLPRRTGFAIHALAAMLIVQLSLGIVTLIQVVPVPLAVAHQAGAMALFTLALIVTHALRRPKR